MRPKHTGQRLGARRIAGAVWAFCVAIATATLAFLILGATISTPGDGFGLGGLGGLAFVLVSVSFATVGALVATRLPGNRVGWIFCLMGVVVGLGTLAYQYGDYGLYGTSRELPGAIAGAWLQNLGLPPAFGLLGLSLLLFPDGRLPSRRWRAAAAPALLGSVTIVLGYALRPGALDSPFERVVNPVGVDGSFGLMNALTSLGWPLMAAGVALAAVSLRIRLRRSHGVEHQQLKWIAFGAAVTGVTIVANVVSFLAFSTDSINELRLVVVGLGFAVLPVTAGIAILRYRLYDIDLIVNRALVYGTLTATLAATYLATVLIVQLALAPLTSDSGLAVAVSTLAAAGVFRPARARIQGAVDHRFFRRRYDAGRTSERFGARMRHEVGIEAVGAELRGVVGQTVAPAHVRLWLREPEARR